MADVETGGSLHRGFAGDRAVRFLAVEARALTEHARVSHGLGPEAARIASEACLAALLMSAWIKGEERITLQLQGERPRLGFVADVDASGGLRARMSPTHLRSAKGGVHGLMLAIKSDRRKELYRGVTLLNGLDVEAAFSAHLRSSSQSDTLLRLGVTQDPDGAIRSAGALLVERLPEHPSHNWISAEQFAADYGMIREPTVPELLGELAFGGIAGTKVELLENRVLRWRCNCGLARVRGVLNTLPRHEVQAMLDEDDGAEVVCHFCNIPWRLTGPDLQSILDERTR